MVISEGHLLLDCWISVQTHYCPLALFVRLVFKGPVMDLLTFMFIFRGLFFFFCRYLSLSVVYPIKCVTIFALLLENDLNKREIKPIVLFSKTDRCLCSHQPCAVTELKSQLSTEWMAFIILYGPMLLPIVKIYVEKHLWTFFYGDVNKYNCIDLKCFNWFTEMNQTSQL